MIEHMTYDAAVMTGLGEGLWVRRAGRSEFQRVSLMPRKALRENRRVLVDLSPDGRIAVVEVRFGVLALIELPDGEAVPLAQPPGRCHTASFSPDGAWLAVMYTDRLGVGVAVRAAAGDDDRIVWHDAGAGSDNESSIAWEPSGDALAITWYGHDDEDDSSTVIVGLDGQQQAEPRLAAHLYPANRGAWNRQGLFVADMNTFEFLTLAGRGPDAEAPTRRLVRTRTHNGLRLIADDDRGHTCPVIDSAGVEAMPPLAIPRGEQISGVRVSDLFDT